MHKSCKYISFANTENCDAPTGERGEPAMPK